MRVSKKNYIRQEIHAQLNQLVMTVLQTMQYRKKTKRKLFNFVNYNDKSVKSS